MTTCCVQSTFSYILGRIAEIEIDSEIPFGFNSKFLIHQIVFTLYKTSLFIREIFHFDEENRFKIGN